jgi:hypothetical protein
VSFWAEHPDPSVSLLSYYFYYSDGTFVQFGANTFGSSWNFFDVTAQLETTKTLTGFSIWGNSSGTTLADDFNLNTVAEPASVRLLLGGFAAMGAVRARRLRRT